MPLWRRTIFFAVVASLGAAPVASQDLNSNDLLNLGLQLLQQQQRQQPLQEQARPQTQQQAAPSQSSQPRYDTAAVREAQSLLTALDFDPGPIDGDMGRRTATAIRDFERSIGLPETGQPSQTVLVALRLDVERRRASGTLTAPPPAAGPSFDCARASTLTERAICSNAGLAALDAELADVFSARVAILDTASQQTLRAEQQRWLSVRDNCGGDPACIDNVIRFRVSELTVALATHGALQAQTSGSVFGTDGGGFLAETALPESFGAESGYSAAMAPTDGAAEPDLFFFSAGAERAFRDLKGLAQELGTELAVAAVRVMPELAESDRSAFALMAGTAPERLVDMLNAEGAASQPQAEAAVGRFLATGDPGQVAPLFQRLSPFAQGRVMAAIRDELPVYLNEVGTLDLPLRARVFCTIGFGPYDLKAQTFPNPGVQAEARQCSALALGKGLPFPLGTEGTLPGFPAELALGPAEAEAFLKRVSPGGFDRYTLGSLFLVSFIAEIGRPEARIGVQGQGVILPMREIGGWQLHLASDRAQVVHRFAEAAAEPGALAANADGTFSFGGRTVLVFGQPGRPGRPGVGPFLDPGPSQSVLAERAYLAAIAEGISQFSDPAQALGMLVLFPEEDWPGILQDAVPEKAAATLSRLGTVVAAATSPQQIMQTVAYALDLNEFETARVAAILRARLPDLVARNASQGAVALRVWCPISLGPWDASAEVFPIYSNSCEPRLANAAPGSVQDQFEARPDGSSIVLPRELPAPAADAEALALMLASPQDSNRREGWMSYDATLTGRGLDAGNGTIYPYLVWTISGPFRLHTVEAPLNTLVEIAVNAPALALEGDALLAAKIAGDLPFDPQDEADVGYLAGVASGEHPMPVGLTVIAYGGSVPPDAQAAGTTTPVLPVQQNTADLSDVFATPSAQIVRVGWQAGNRIDIAEVYALLPAAASAYAVPWPDAIASPNSAAEIRTVLRVSAVGLSETQNAGPVLTLQAEPARARIFLPETPDEIIEIAVAPVEAAPIETLAFPRGAWLATEVANLAGIEAEAFLVDLASQLEGDPFAARDLAKGWRDAVVGAGPEDGRFWIAGNLQLEPYDFETESFRVRPLSIRMPTVDGSEEVLFRRLRFQFPDGALAVRLPPDGARAWQERTGLVGTNAPFRAEVRLAGLADTGSASYTLKLDLVALEILAADAPVTLVEDDKIVWRSAAAMTWAEDASVAAPAAPPASATEPATAPPTPAASALLTADVAGLTVGMPADAFRIAAAALFDGVAIPLATPNADPATPWGTATGFTDATMSQTLIALHPPGRPDGPVIALMRRLSLQPGAATPEAVRLSLIAKYGPDLFDAQDYALFWGLPTDPARQIACAPFRAGAEGSPDLVLDPAASVEAGSAVSQPGIWGRILPWPPSAATSSAIATVDPASHAGCGPTITAFVREEAGGGLDLIVWSIDMAAAARLLADPAFAPPTLKPAEIKL